LRVFMANNVSVNGNSVSRTGTSRIDDVLLTGQFGQLQDPILEIPDVIRNTDDELVLLSQIVAGSGHVPVGRFIQMESDSGNILITIDPLSAFTHITSVNEYHKATLYRVRHCLDIRTKVVC